MTSRLSLSVLVDNNTLIDRYFLGEPGLSILIETGDRRILFDTGYSDAFIRNAETMGIDLLDLDYVVLSHGHLDHTWGLVHLVQKLAGAEIHSLSHKKPVLLPIRIVFIQNPAPRFQTSVPLYRKKRQDASFPSVFPQNRSGLPRIWCSSVKFPGGSGLNIPPRASAGS